MRKRYLFGVFRNMSFRNYCLLLLICLHTPAAAQNDSLQQKAPELTISAMLDFFYVYDANHPSGPKRQPFLVSYNRQGQVNLNLGLLRFGCESSRYRAHVALQAGTYARDNYAAEPAWLQHVFEANAGISLNRRQNLWLDAGVFGSHIGFESAVAAENWTLTRSLLAENSPYYSAGFKLGYKPDERWEWVALLLSGWQRIQPVPGNSLPSFGTQIKFSPSWKLSFNWSTFAGTNDPDSQRRMRYFSNLYAQWSLSKKWRLIAGFDMGIQQRQRHSAAYNPWFSPVMIAQYTLSRDWTAALRAEYYQDTRGVIIPISTPHGFQTAGLSLNVDYAPKPYLLCRLEGRWLRSRERIFEHDQTLSNRNISIAASLSIRFSESFRRKVSPAMPPSDL